MAEILTPWYHPDPDDDDDGEPYEPQMRVEMVDPQRVLLEEVADPRMTRDDVAQTYAFGLRQPDSMDWSTVNKAIIERWSLSALKHIKERAWRLVRGG